ncbi:dockerin type I domain-containing protein, partial [Planctomycetota bacterium]
FSLFLNFSRINPRWIRDYWQRKDKYYRFSADPNKIGANHDWSGVARHTPGFSNVLYASWGTSITPSYLISTGHQQGVFLSNVMRMYASNSSTLDFVDKQMSAVVNYYNEPPYKDLSIRRLQTPVPTTYVSYPIYHPGDSNLVDPNSPQPFMAFGLHNRSSTDDLIPQYQKIWTNVITSAYYSQGVLKTAGYKFDMDDAPSSEGLARTRDSGAPVFIIVGGTQDPQTGDITGGRPALLGYHWTGAQHPDASGLWPDGTWRPTSFVFPYYTNVYESYYYYSLPGGTLISALGHAALIETWIDTHESGPSAQRPLYYNQTKRSDINGDNSTTAADLVRFVRWYGQNGYYNMGGDISNDGQVNWDDVEAYLSSFYSSAAGDVNLDGFVDVADLQIMGNNYEAPGTGWGWEDGDLNGDGIVNSADVVIWGNENY